MSTVKKPQDHKTTDVEQAAQKQVRFDEVEGHELLKPFSKVKGSDQLRLMGQLKGLGLLNDDDKSEGNPDDASGLEIDDLNIDKLADLIDYVSEKFALNPDEFDEFTSGKGGYERAINLAIAYAGELGNAEASETS